MHFSLLCNFMKSCWCLCGEPCSDPDWWEAWDAKRSKPLWPDPFILLYGGDQGLIQFGAVPHDRSPSNKRIRWEVRGKPKLFLPPDLMIFQPSPACSHSTSSARFLARRQHCGAWRWQRRGASVTSWPGVGREEGSRQRQRVSWAEKGGMIMQQ